MSRRGVSRGPVSRATWSALAALCCALLLSGCASTPGAGLGEASTERVQRYGFDGFGAAQGSSGGGGGLGAGGTATGAIVLDAGGGSTGGLTINDAASNADLLLYESSGTAILQGDTGVALNYSTANKVIVNSASVNFVNDVTPLSASGASLGTTALEWANVYVGTGKVFLGAGQDNAITRAGRGQIALQDPTDSAGLGMRLDFVSAAGGTPTTYYLDFDHGGGYMQASGSFMVGNGLGYVLYMGSTTGPTMRAGSGTPEGAVSAYVGSLFFRTDGGTGTSVYVKESGAGTNTGWVAK